MGAGFIANTSSALPTMPKRKRKPKPSGDTKSNTQKLYEKLGQPWPAKPQPKPQPKRKREPDLAKLYEKAVQEQGRRKQAFDETAEESGKKWDTDFGWCFPDLMGESAQTVVDLTNNQPQAKKEPKRKREPKPSGDTPEVTPEVIDSD